MVSLYISTRMDLVRISGNLNNIVASPLRLVFRPVNEPALFVAASENCSELHELNWWLLVSSAAVYGLH